MTQPYRMGIEHCHSPINEVRNRNLSDEISLPQELSASDVLPRLALLKCALFFRQGEIMMELENIAACGGKAASCIVGVRLSLIIALLVVLLNAQGVKTGALFAQEEAGRETEESKGEESGKAGDPAAEVKANPERKTKAVPQTFPEFDVTAPPAADSEQRMAQFSMRNNEQELKKLCDRFFALLHDKLDITKEPFVLYRAGKYQQALDAYRNGFMQRLKNGSSQFPVVGKITPDPGRAEGEMNNYLYLAAVKGDLDWRAPGAYEAWRQIVTNTPRVTLRVNLGAPGAINYTYIPSEYVYFENCNSSEWIHNETRKFIFTNKLIDQYAVTGDVKYINKWCEYLDALHTQWADCGLSAGLQVTIAVNELEWYTNHFWPQMIAVARAQPAFAKDISSATLARTLIHMWRVYVPVQLRLARYITGNRLSHMYTQKFIELGMSFPEFIPSDYVLREKRRALEVYPVASAFPDGGDVNFAYNYEFNWPDVAVGVISAFGRGKPGYMSPEWMTQMNDAISMKYRKLAHEVFVDGSTPHWRKPGKDYEFKWRDIAWQNGNRIMAPWLTDFSDNLRVLNTVYGDGSLGKPEYTSEAFPYTGFYHLRSGWTKQDQDLFFCAYRPLTYRGESMVLHLRLYAYGAPLIQTRGGGRLDVDGCAKIEDETAHLYPAEQLADWRTTRYARSQSHMGASDVLPNRFHAGKQFDFAEATYKGAFAGNDKFIDGIQQTRQIFFLRDAGLWIVTDRIEAEGTHAYAVSWEIPDGGKNPSAGFRLDDLMTDDANAAIITNSQKYPNISMRMISEQPIKIAPVSSEVKVDRLPNGWMGRYLKDTQSIHLTHSLSGSGDQIWTTVIYPRKSGMADLKEFRAVKENGVNGFDATLSDGRRVFYRCVGEAGMLRAGTAEGTATALLSLEANDTVNGILLDGKDVRVSGQASGISGNCEFGGGTLPIRRPLGLVQILPNTQDVFTDSLEVELKHPEPGVEIRYTVNRSDPDLTSPVYTAPIRIDDTTMIKAIAVRQGVKKIVPVLSSNEASLPNSAIYTKCRYLPAQKVQAVMPGIRYDYYQGDYTLTNATFPLGEKSMASGMADKLFDISAKKAGAKDNFGFVYRGYLNVPRDGVYTFHAPEEFMHWGIDANYDLRVFVDGREWYPGTFRYNFRNWSVALQAGYHSLRVEYLDMRGSDEVKKYFMADENKIIGGKPMWRYRVWDGQVPELMLSGPGLPRQAVPAQWLCTGKGD